MYHNPPEDSNSTAVICYITFIGWLIAFTSLYPRQKNSFTALHIRQALLIHILSAALSIAYALTVHMNLAFMIVCLLGMILFATWLFAVHNAVRNRLRSIPILGQAAQRLFRRL